MIHIHAALNLWPFALHGRLGRSTEISRDVLYSKIKTINRQNSRCSNIPQVYKHTKTDKRTKERLNDLAPVSVSRITARLSYWMSEP